LSCLWVAASLVAGCDRTDSLTDAPVLVDSSKAVIPPVAEIDSVLIGGSRYLNPSFNGTGAPRGTASAADSTPSATINLVAYHANFSLALVASLEAPSPGVGSFDLTPTDGSHASVHLNRYRPGQDTCNYASIFGSFAITRWTDTTIASKTVRIVSGTLRTALALPWAQKSSCEATVSLVQSFHAARLRTLPR